LLSWECKKEVCSYAEQEVEDYQNITKRMGIKYTYKIAHTVLTWWFWVAQKRQRDYFIAIRSENKKVTPSNWWNS
jgi:hypothetical protein